eukprot:gene6006-6078_t
MSIGTRILLVVAMLGLSLSALLGIFAEQTWSDRSRAADQQALSGVSGNLIAAGLSLAVERGLTNGQLADVAKMPEEVRARIMSARAGQQAAFGAASLTEADRAALQPVMAALERLRAEFDAAVAGRGPAPASAAWFGTASAAIDGVVGLRRRLDARGSSFTTQQSLVGLRDRVAELAEFAGRERGLINGMIAGGGKATPEQIYALGTLAGRIDGAWSMIGPATANVDASVIKAVEQARAAWAEGLGPIRQAILKAAATGEKWPVSGSVWFEAASSAIDRMNAAQKLGGAVLQDLLSAEQERLRMLALAATLAVAAALCVSLGVSVYVRRSVLRPLSRMIAIMSELAAGRLDVVIPAARGRDEIARLIAATIRFRETARQAEAMAQAQSELRQSAETSRRDALRDIGDMIGEVSDEAVSGVCTLTGDLQSVASEVHCGAGAMAADSAQIAADADIARQSSMAAAGQARELTSAIGEIAQQIERAARSTREAVGRTQETELVFSTLIAQRIGAIEASTRAAVSAVEGISASITEIDGVAAMVAAAVEQQAASTAGIAEAVDRMSGAADRVAERMQTMSAGTMACAAQAGRLSSISNDVNGQVTGIKGTLVGIMCQRVAALDRRAERRVGVSVAGSLRQGGVGIAGTVADISVIGLRFVTDAATALGENDLVQLCLPGLPLFDARVVRTERLLVHLDFRECSEPSRAQLQAWIDRHAAVARAA